MGKRKKKVIILHDTFLYKWWWERLVMMMWKVLKSDIASGFFSIGSFDLRSEWFEGKMISVSSEIFKKGFRHIKLKLAFLYKTKFLSAYSTVIFSWDCISAVRNCDTKSKKIFYCHTPPRYIYDLHDEYLRKVKWYIRPFFIGFCKWFQKVYERDIHKMDIVLTNSLNTQARIKKYLWIDSIILYPPVDRDLFQFISQEDFYLSFARLADAKRVDMIVRAFMQMPDKNLVVVYGENDPQRSSIFDISKGYKNITFITLPGNIGFTDYIGKCIATIYVPIDEDFGMSPVESMSAGKPVIGVDDGGLRESVIHEKTGVLLPQKIRISDIIHAVETMTPEKALSMRKACEKRAKDFSLGRFEKQLEQYI